MTAAARIHTQFETRPLTALREYDKNARTHSKAQVEQLARSIREFGFTNPVLITPDGLLIAGHGRVEAARSLGMTEVPCIVVDGMSEAQRVALTLADNRIAMNAGWDFTTLQQELAALTAQRFDVSLIGFSVDELHDLLQSPATADELDNVPPPPQNPVTQLGDLWRLGEHRLICGDSTAVDVVDRLLDGTPADICWTDPPYNVAYKTKAGSIANDDLNDAQFREFLEAAFRTAWTAMQPGASIYIAHADTEGLNFRAAFAAAGFKLSGCLVWRKDSLVLGRSDYQWQHEPILYGWKPGAAHRWFGGRKQTTLREIGAAAPFTQLPDGRFAVLDEGRMLVIDGAATVTELLTSVIAEKKPTRNADHPTMKPVALIERLLKNSSRHGDVVLDPFGGSGSTLVAAERLNMRARLVELDPRYCDVIVARWERLTGGRAERIA